MNANPFIEHDAQHQSILGGDCWTFRFRNGFGASVVSHAGSHGGTAGLWELAVLDSEGDLDYSTPITSDVIGWQSVEDVRELLRRIAELPA